MISFVAYVFVNILHTIMLNIEHICTLGEHICFVAHIWVMTYEMSWTKDVVN